MGVFGAGSSIKALGANASGFFGAMKQVLKTTDDDIARAVSKTTVAHEANALFKEAYTEMSDDIVKNVSKRNMGKVNNLIKDVNPENYKEVNKQLFNMGKNGKASNTIADVITNGTGGLDEAAKELEGIYSTENIKEALGVSYTKSAVKAYLNGTDVADASDDALRTIKRTRRTVAGVGAVGAYAGVNAIGRGISGGNLTTNKKGERDIAGIPFI